MAIKARIKNPLTRKARPVKVSPNFGLAGAPIDTKSPFYFGFITTFGVLSAIVLARALASVSQVLILILVATFLATGLNPAVEALQKRKLSRSASVAVIFLGVFGFLGLFISFVIPPVISQGNNLINSAPALLTDLKSNAWIADINNQFGIIDTLQNQINKITSDGTLIISAFGGVVGVGKSVLSGTFTALTILVLTLYFITSLPQATQLGLRFVPASRRDRVGKLTDAVIAQVGAFVGSQILIAFLAAIFVTITSALLGMPSPFAIGMIILVVALVPLIGHFIGAAVFTIIALTESISTGVIAIIFYVVYVQVENYIITPRIMKRTLNVPGAVTIVSALIGSSLLGLIGGLLAVPVAASIILILQQVVFPKTDKH